MVAFAQKKGLKGISITDHYDLDPPKGVRAYNFDPLDQQNEIDEVKKPNNSLQIFKGIEVGIQPSSMDRIKSFLDRYNFDVIVASAHFVNGQDPFSGNYYKSLDWKEAYRNYLISIDQSISDFRNFDILGHFDYIVRYSPYTQKTLEYAHFQDILDGILRKLANWGKALEINTNTYRFRYGTYVKLDIGVLKRFKELGGEFITLGSDAHDVERVGEDFDAFRSIIKSAGFNYITHFNKRQHSLTKLK